MFLEQAKKFLINAHMVTYQDPLISTVDHKKQPKFEFIFDEKLKILECIEVTPAQSVYACSINPIIDLSNLYRVLFELNHIRVNPKLDNQQIISMLTDTLSEIGIRINNQPNENSLAICFKPLGEIMDSVRFYIKENNTIVFLAKRKPKLMIVH